MDELHLYIYAFSRKTTSFQTVLVCYIRGNSFYAL